MKIAVLGAGNIGGRLAKGWVAAGHDVVVGLRDPQKNDSGVRAATLKSACEGAEVVVFAVPATAAYETAKVIGPLPPSVVIIDAMNAVFRKPEPYSKTSEAIIAGCGSDNVVKCFNWIGAENLDDPIYNGVAADMLLCGNRPESKAKVKTLAEVMGFNVFDVGGLDKEGLLEQGAALWGALAYGAGLGRNIAFKILKK